MIITELTVVVSSFNPSTWKTEAGGSQGVLGQSDLNGGFQPIKAT